MSNSNSNSSAAGIGFTGLLQILFIALKLLGVTQVATWSWLWVLAPTWMPIVLIILIALVHFVISTTFDKIL